MAERTVRCASAADRIISIARTRNGKLVRRSIGLFSTLAADEIIIEMFVIYKCRVHTSHQIGLSTEVGSGETRSPIDIDPSAPWRQTAPSSVIVSR